MIRPQRWQVRCSVPKFDAVYYYKSYQKTFYRLSVKGLLFVGFFMNSYMLELMSYIMQKRKRNYYEETGI